MLKSASHDSVSVDVEGPEEQNDLLDCVWKLGSRHGRADRARLVLLRMETATTSETRLSAAVVYVCTGIAAIVLIALVVLKSIYTYSVNIISTDAYEICLVVLSLLSFGLISERLGAFLANYFLSRSRKQIWKPRRARIALLVFIAAVVQLVNCFMWFLPNVYIVANWPSCKAINPLTDFSGVIRWTCWNTTLILYLMTASQLLTWKHLRGGRGNNSSGHGATTLLYMDAPLWYQLVWAPLWLAYEVGILMLVDFFIHEFDDSGPIPTIPPGTPNRPPYNCAGYQGYFSCDVSNVGYAGSIVIVAMTCIYYLLFLLTIWRARRQLKHKPFSQFRAANILIQLQMRTTLLTFKITTISTSALWLIYTKSCWSFVTTWLGVAPMQLVASALTWQSLWLFSPKIPDNDPALLAWLQEPAWTEQGLQDHLQERNTWAEGDAHRQQLQREPMFCFETALKLLKWSSLAYSDLHKTQWPLRKAVDPDRELPARLSEETLKIQSTGSPSARDSAEGGGRLMHSHRMSADEDMDREEDASTSGAAGNESFRTSAGLTDAESSWQDYEADMADVDGLVAGGTASLANAFLDIKAWRVDHHGRKAAASRRAPRVHTGFHEAWCSNGLDRQVIGHLQELYSTGQVSSDARMYITGHSLGGALAVLAAHDIAVELSPPCMQVVTFGCPHMGDAAFQQGYNSLVPDTWHIIHDRDVVTRMGKFWVLGKRPGHRVLIDLHGGMLVRPTALEVQVQTGSKLRNHALRTYRTALLSAFLTQFSRRGNPANLERCLALQTDPVLRDDLEKDGIDWAKLNRYGQLQLKRRSQGDAGSQAADAQARVKKRKREPDAGRLAKFQRGPGVATRKIRDKKLQGQLHHTEQLSKDAAAQAARVDEWLLPSEAGLLETEGMERSYRLSQKAIIGEAEVGVTRKVFDLQLDRLGPYSLAFTRNGRQMLLGGRKGHLALMDWQRAHLLSEVQVRETIHDVTFLHNELFYAAAQKKHVYIYDHRGIEIHCLKEHTAVQKLEFLPYHFLLASIGEHGVLRYQDTSTGQILAQHRTRMGPCSVMRHNPWNAVIALGHGNGTVTHWTPNMGVPAVRMLCHKGPLRALAVDATGRHLVTAGADSMVKGAGLAECADAEAERALFVAHPPPCNAVAPPLLSLRGESPGQGLLQSPPNNVHPSMSPYTVPSVPLSQQRLTHATHPQDWIPIL
ncbi:hypothetical protein WJX73_003153 [Symbiochloris irregularis]|uniref:Fungal lipase-type domain-containing protein n=1 Tax=Symbiochloris irregularis TaxID=706552 RepID=A0AAW1P0J2_9CHLO